MFSNSFDRSLLDSARLTFLFFVVTFLSGCVGSDMSELERFVEATHKDKKPEIEPLPEIPPFKAFAYASEEEVDPFSSGNIVANDGEGRSVGSTKRPNADRRRQPLEKFPLDALRMVGTITKQGVSHVVVKTNEGTALLATVGEYMGKNDGKITSIIPEEQRIELTETVLAPSGRWVTRDVEIIIDE